VRWWDEDQNPTYIEVETGVEEQDQDGNYARYDGVVDDYEKLKDKDGEALWLVPNKEIAREIANIFHDQGELSREITKDQSTYNQINQAIWDDSQSWSDGESLESRGLPGFTRFQAWKKYLDQVQSDNPELPSADLYEAD
jgi:hypothetical protein